jgi:3-keto-disaccharide hydrolase
MKRLSLVLILLLLSALSSPAQSNGWKQLFNGKDFTGWKHVGPGKFTIEDGMLKSQGGMGLLWYTPQKLGGVTLRVVYKLSHADDNSGVYIRIPERPTEPWMPVNKAHEIQIYDPGDDYHCTGVIYSFTKALARPHKPVGDWNTMDITLAGPRTVVVLNGVKVTDYTQTKDSQPPKPHEGDPDRGPRPDVGYIGLQNHGGDAQVIFKEVAIKKLNQ